MAVEHKNIPEDGLHEPKGVSNAPQHRVYVASGTGTGVWSLVDADSLQGTLNNSLPAGLRLITDGSGGVSSEATPASAFGTLNLTDNATVKAVTAATDTTLNTNTDFTVLDITLSTEALVNMGSTGNSLITEAGGLYLIDFWANVKSNINATKFSLKFVINDTTFVSRGPKLTLSTANQIYNMSANGIHTFADNDTVKLYIAADKNADITIEDMTFQMVYLGA